MLDNTFVNDVMSKNVVSVEKSVWLAEVAKKMDTFNIGSVIVTENSKPIGIVTERDFVTKTALPACNNSSSFKPSRYFDIFFSKRN